MSWRARPKLAITSDGLAVRGWFGTRRLGRQDVAKIRITEFRRIGRKVRLLEIDTVADDRLLVFTRWDLGTDPLHVLDALTDAGLRGRVLTHHRRTVPTRPARPAPRGAIERCVTCVRVRRR